MVVIDKYRSKSNANKRDCSQKENGGRRRREVTMMRKRLIRNVIWLLIVFLVVPPGVFAQQAQEETQKLKPEELDALLAPIALYPDELLAQVLMASTYPLEIVQADRWVKANKNLKGDPLTDALEKQDWDPSVKSLANFPQVLAMMSEKLDWTQKLGDAFLDSEKDVMDTVQKLRTKAQETGNLKTTEQQKVIVQEKVIVIEPAQPKVIYVPTYNPTVVYGPWWYPAYPPYPVYPPGYVAATAAFSFAAGVAIGAAWGYAWGGCNWHGGNVNVNVNRNINVNQNINRNNYAQKYQGGGGNWQHDSSHRKGVSYRDQATAQKFNKGTSADAARSRDAYRGRTDQGRQGTGQTRDRQTPGSGQQGLGQSRDKSAFGGMDHGSNVQKQSDRGRQSREGISSRGNGGGSRPSGGGGGSRGGGGRR
jgi:hypothetical protein